MLISGSRSHKALHLLVDQLDGTLHKPLAVARHIRNSVLGIRIGTDTPKSPEKRLTLNLFIL
jgi:hypothetical protein